MKSYAFPGNIEEDILAIGAQQIPYMRTKEFSETNKESERILNDLIGNKDGRVIIYTGSGTGAMDAVVANYVTTRRKTLVIDGGSFGHRWSQLCDYYSCSHIDIKLDFGKGIDYEHLEKVIRVERPDTLLCQHHETSSGQLYDIEKIGELCRKYEVSLVVDVISSFLVEDIDMEKLGIDIAITSSQKGLNIPPGLSILFFSNRLLDYPFAHKSYYFDFQDNLNNLTRGQTPFSPATLIFLQLNARLKEYEKNGVEPNKQRVKEAAEYFRSLCDKYEWSILAETPSYAITGFQINGDPEKVIRGLIEKYDTFIMPGSRKGFFRVSHMGVASKKDLENLAQQIHELEMQ